MNMKIFEHIRSKRARRVLIPMVVLGAVLALAGYELEKPARAEAAAPAAAPLDDSSVSALLALDAAMEKLAARVTPAIVNVTVTSRPAPERGEATEGNPGDD